ncbi:MAG: hypothetical protein ABIA75_03445 [Candidatus Neomarinimicrobiota bacterium]
MIEFISSTGIIIWPLWVITLVIIIMAVSKIRILSGDNVPFDRDLAGEINAILFWGVIALFLGIYGQVWVLGHTLRNRVVQPEGINLRELLLGLKTSLNPLVLGLSILLVAIIVWSVLRVRLRQKIRHIDQI